MPYGPPFQGLDRPKPGQPKGFSTTIYNLPKPETIMHETIQVTQDSIQSIASHYSMRPSALNASDKERRTLALIRSELIAAALPQILQVWNTNTIDSDLKRTVILQQMIRAFAIRVLPLSAFATRFDGVRLEGTGKAIVPHFSLDQTASHDWVAADGYNTFGNTDLGAKTIEINRRKYQGLSFTSEELARQPFLDIAMAASLKAEQLGLDVVNDVLSVVTASNFGDSVKTEPAEAFDSSDLLDLKGVADLANWPIMGRSVILNSGYDINVLKDSSVKDASQFGDNAPIREGRVQRIAGFEYYPDGRVPDNSENLEGFIAWKSAILVAFSPIRPAPEIRQQLSRYEIIVEPTTGVTMEYRLWGDPDMDTSKEVIEANYGFTVGESAALLRITSE